MTDDTKESLGCIGLILAPAIIVAIVVGSAVSSTSRYIYVDPYGERYLKISEGPGGVILAQGWDDDRVTYRVDWKTFKSKYRQAE